MFRWIAAVALTLLGGAGASRAQDHRPAGVSIRDAWTRPTASRAASAVGYLTVENAGASADRLLGGATPFAARIEIHRTTTVTGIVRMREAPDGVVIPPHAHVAFAPNGYHLMLVAPTRRFRVGEKISATLRFEKAGAVATVFEVRAGLPMAPMTMR